MERSKKSRLSPPSVLLPSALSLSLSHAAAIKRMNPTFQNTDIGGRKPKFDSGKTIKNAEEITQNLLLLSTFSGILLWLSMISRFLCFSKAYLCRGQSSPKRRWIVVASWRQLWRRPWRRRFGIVKRTLCVCVCVCLYALKSEA